MNHSMKLSLCVLATLAVAACSSTHTTSTAQDPTEPDGGLPVKPKAPDGGSSGSSGSSGSTDPDAKCAQESSQQACGQCCIQNHPSGYQVFLSAVLACACGASGDAGQGACATECASTACKATPSQPDTACNACLQGAIGSGGACSGPVTSACSADADCMAEQQCLTPCQSKN